MLAEPIDEKSDIRAFWHVEGNLNVNHDVTLVANVNCKLRKSISIKEAGIDQSDGKPAVLTWNDDEMSSCMDTDDDDDDNNTGFTDLTNGSVSVGMVENDEFSSWHYSQDAPIGLPLKHRHGYNHSSKWESPEKAINLQVSP